MRGSEDPIFAGVYDLFPMLVFVLVLLFVTSLLIGPVVGRVRRLRMKTHRQYDITGISEEPAAERD